MFSNRAKYWVRGLQSCGIFKHRHIFGDIWVASKIQNFPHGLQSCGVFKHCHIYGCFNALNVLVAGNLVVFSNLAKYLVRGLHSCGIFKHCLVGGFKLKSLNFSPLSIAFLVASID